MASENGRSVSWGWLAATLFGVVVAMTPYALRGFIGPTPQPAPAQAVVTATSVSTDDLRRLETRVSAMETAFIQQASTNREIQAEQERQGKLIEGIARRMGILVAR